MARNLTYAPLPDSFDSMKDYKESAELSRNLVGAEYGKVMDKPRGSRPCKVVLVVIVVGLIAWLLGLTVLRELQLRKLGSEVEHLREDVEKLRTQVDVLNQHMDSQKALLSDLNVYEDGVYAELGSSEAVADSFPPEPPHKSAMKLDIITDDDDEDLYDEDGEDGASGWYQDYDNKRKDGTSEIVHLKPEEFLGKVLNARPSDAPVHSSKLNEIRRLLHNNFSEHSDPVLDADSEDKPAEGVRSRRSVSELSPHEESVDEDPRTAAHHSWRSNKLMRETDAPLSAQDTMLPESARLAESSRKTRNSDDQSNRAFIAAHFHGNTSHMNTETHPHYKGNGLVRVAHDAPHSVWWPADWSRAAPHPAAPVLTRRGHVRVRHTGIYLVYVQIYYLDAHDITGWVLHRSGPDNDREALLQCAATSPSAETQDKPNSCYSAAALLLREGDRLLVRNTGGDRHSLMQPEKSFIGLIKLADADVADDY